ncbi:S8 family serine peptidase [Sandaracinobacter sp. RS1-74]|uniref:S8 family serine peptidase n=1 Tax=Sandaracinobacteroides sayramensis TaxID=2913411 RepID=UPI001ED9D93A|nr:S8 family serine peptidase [Sandaracinobacteroides sayramensis]MCG2842508.1 S8 family serine peptidase [Sandaracinobacteroides sayramensis]
MAGKSGDAFGQDYRIVGTLVKLSGQESRGFASAARDFARQGEVILETEAGPDSMGVADAGATWLRFDQSGQVWEQVHELARRGGMGFGANAVLAAEPDRQWTRSAGPAPASGSAAFNAWHLQRTGLDKARAQVAADRQKDVLVAHLDTGFDPDHRQKPRNIDPLHRSFVKGDSPQDGARTPGGGLPGLEQPGHGTGTLSILAGPDFGGCPDASLLPLRVGKDVVLVTTGSVVAGFREAIRRGADVLSMSMGGLASKAMADAVNAAYERGLVMVTAAGNTFFDKPFPTIVWPARFRRVVAACGMMQDGRPYEWPNSKPMAGCHGPAAKMLYALSAFTPDIPWAELGTGDKVGRAGGTSSATPQIAAAVALWLAQWKPALKDYLPWQRGEAARQALFASAREVDGEKVHAKFGHGLLDAAKLLATAPLPQAELRKAPVADASFHFLKLVSGRGVGFADRERDALFELELIQLLEAHRELAGEDGQATTDLPEPESLDPANAEDVAAVRRVLERVEASDLASAPLRATLRARLAGEGAAGPAFRTPPAPAGLPRGRAPAPPADTAHGPARRRLRIYARDPSLAASLSTSAQLVSTVDVVNERDLKPGPVGEYLEIVDVDPPTDRLYPPVDLNDVQIALSDGLRPSEGNPQFHQQMVYAVGMRTIEAFEEALGRRMLWASGRQPGDTSAERRRIPAFRQRLRIYPHALREANAFYSPHKVAILFGYSPSNADTRSAVPQGTMVFSCLSADVIAHEMTHALLDGISPALRDASNPDVLAFHEGFADIVALFEQFRLRDIVASQVAVGGRDFSMGGMLGTLALQLGQGRGGDGPLRDYQPKKARGENKPALQYDTDLPVHELGSVLVFAVYEAFLAVAGMRTGELTRLATGGTGRLPDGELHPVLVKGLTSEICKAASEVQRIVIRALDYLPPNDISYGDYLRALVTADVDAWPEDLAGYRIAIIEAFRQLDIYPRGLRTLSEETLVWRRPEPALRTAPWLTELVESFDLRPGTDYSRARMQQLSQRRADLATSALHKALAAELAAGETRLHELLGLEPGLPLYGPDFEPFARKTQATRVYVDDVRPKMRDLGQSEQTTQRLAFDVVIRIRQRRPEWVDPADPSAGRFWFRGGTTLIVDPFATRSDEIVPEIRYSIVKPMLSATRLERERNWRAGRGSEGVRAAYFGQAEGQADAFGADEIFAIVHSRIEEGEA